MAAQAPPAQQQQQQQQAPDRVLRTATWALVCLVALSAVASSPSPSLFAAHPVAMALAYALLVESALAFNRNYRLRQFQYLQQLQSQSQSYPQATTSSYNSSNSKNKVKGRVEQIDVHSSLAFAAVASTILGFIHFTSWHGWIGCSTACMIAVQSLAGYMAHTLKFPRLIWKLHRWSGVLSFIGLSITSYLHISSTIIKESWMSAAAFFYGCGILSEILLITTTFIFIARAYTT